MDNVGVVGHTAAAAYCIIIKEKEYVYALLYTMEWAMDAQLGALSKVKMAALGFLFLHQCRSYSIVRWPLSMKTTTKSKGIRPRWNEHPGRLATSCMHIGKRCQFFLTLLYPWYYVNCREEQQPATKRLLCFVFLVSKRGGVVVVGHCIPLLMRWWDESKMSWIQKKQLIINIFTISRSGLSLCWLPRPNREKFIQFLLALLCSLRRAGQDRGPGRGQNANFRRTKPKAIYE